MIRTENNCLGFCRWSSASSHCINWNDLNFIELKVVSETNQLDRGIRGVILTLSPSLFRPQAESSQELDLSVFLYACRPTEFTCNLDLNSSRS